MRSEEEADTVLIWCRKHELIQEGSTKGTLSITRRGKDVFMMLAGLITPASIQRLTEEHAAFWKNRD